MKTAVVLLSGGLDSAVTLYQAKSLGFKCFCLLFDYGQRHRREIAAAKRIAAKAGCHVRVIRIKFPWKGSSLLDRKAGIRVSPGSSRGIPGTYVPGRNIIFLSFALSCAETINASAIFIGAHTGDYSGYPDCRPEFFRAFQGVSRTGTKAGAEKHPVRIFTPLIGKHKSEIIRLGNRLGVPFGLTWSCYRGGRSPCGKCDSCYFRAKGFKEAGLSDPALKC